MKQIKFLVALLITTFAISVGHASPPITEQLKNQYTSQIGVKELTGNNDGPQVERYLHTVNLPKGYPWCAAFVKWNLLAVGITEANKITGMATSCYNANNVVYVNHTFKKQPQSGDVFTIYYKHLNRIGHTGFFDKRINSKLFKSVEGNTNYKGSRDGDGVYYKYRSFNTIHNISRWI